MRRFALAICFALALVAFPLSAAAKEPTVLHYPLNPPDITVSGICAFNLTIHSTIQVTEIDYYDASGAPSRTFIHATEQDTFTRSGASGPSLTTFPYTFDLELRFDQNGNLTAFVASGLVLKVQLPDGSLFVSAGRIDFIAHPRSGFAVAPDVGHSGDVGAFCAALAGS